MFQQRQRLGGLLLAQQQDAGVQLGFEQAGLEFQRLAIFRDAFRVAVQHAVGQRQVEVRGVILGVGRGRLAERLHGGFVLAVVQGLDAVGNVVRGLEEEQRD